VESDVLPGSTTPSLNRTSLEHEFDFASDANNHCFKVNYPNAGLWSVPPERPVLHIAGTETNSVLLFWPTQAVNFALQSVNELGATNWVNVTNPPTLPAPTKWSNCCPRLPQPFSALPGKPS
jgi:hypothetical protein